MQKSGSNSSIAGYLLVINSMAEASVLWNSFQNCPKCRSCNALVRWSIYMFSVFVDVPWLVVGCCWNKPSGGEYPRLARTLGVVPHGTTIEVMLSARHSLELWTRGWSRWSRWKGFQPVVLLQPLHSPSFWILTNMSKPRHVQTPTF